MSHYLFLSYTNYVEELTSNANSRGCVGFFRGLRSRKFIQQIGTDNPSVGRAVHQAFSIAHSAAKNQLRRVILTELFGEFMSARKLIIGKILRFVITDLGEYDEKTCTNTDCSAKCLARRM